MKTILFLLMLGLPLFAFGAQNRQGAPTPATGPRPAANPDCASRADCPLNFAISAAPTTLVASDLVFAIEEERVAHDLYVAASAKWNLRIFANIAQAETRHAAALTQLAATAGLILPAAQTGVYVTTDLQQLHDQLLALVNESETGALRAAALIEETDLADLRRLAVRATDAGSKAVLADLERASGHHLAAFVRNLAIRGVTYQPQVLAADDFAALIDIAPGRGSGGNLNSNGGRGRGFQGGR